MADHSVGGRDEYESEASEIHVTSTLVSFGSMLSLVSTTGVVEVLSLGNSTVIFASCDSV